MGIILIFAFDILNDSKAMTALVAPGGALDNSLYVGRLGVFEIINRCAANWRIDVDGNPLKDIERRMVCITKCICLHLICVIAASSCSFFNLYFASAIYKWRK